MKIGIDVSQVAYDNTGVANYLVNLVNNLIKIDKENEYVLFFSSLRRRIINSKLKIPSYNSKITIKEYRFPPVFLNFVWNKLHIIPIENFIGDVDVFISSDWTEPPARRAKKITILYDLVVFKNPEETAEKIVCVHKNKLKWTVKESSLIICISEATKKDAKEILGISESKLKVIYPGV